MKKLIEKFEEIDISIQPKDCDTAKDYSNRLYSSQAEECKKVAISFGDWLSINNYEPIHGNRWCKKFMSFTESSEELFNKFIEKEYGK